MLGLRLWLAGSLLGSYAAGGPPGGIERRRQPKMGILIPLLIIGIVLDLAVSAVLVPLLFSARDSAQKAQRAVSAAAIAKVAAYDLCVADNERRAAERGLWRGVLELIETPQNAHDPGVARFVDQVNALVAIADRPQTCTRPVPDP